MLSVCGHLENGFLKLMNQGRNEYSTLTIAQEFIFRTPASTISADFYVVNISSADFYVVNISSADFSRGKHIFSVIFTRQAHFPRNFHAASIFSRGKHIFIGIFTRQVYFQRNFHAASIFHAENTFSVGNKLRKSAFLLL
jgi:hypothetical protein